MARSKLEPTEPRVRDINPRARAMLDGILTGAVPYPAMWATIPVQLIEARRGRVVMRTVADERHINAHGTTTCSVRRREAKPAPE